MLCWQLHTLMCDHQNVGRFRIFYNLPVFLFRIFNLNKENQYSFTEIDSLITYVLSTTKHESLSQKYVKESTKKNENTHQSCIKKSAQKVILREDLVQILLKLALSCFFQFLVRFQLYLFVYSFHVFISFSAALLNYTTLSRAKLSE